MSPASPYNYKGYPVGLEYPWEFPLPSERERDLRWSAIRKSMQKHNLDCLIIGGAFSYITFPNNYVYYVSNFVPFFNPGTYVVFPLNGDPQLGFGSRLGPQFVHCATETAWIKEIVENPNPARDIVSKVTRLGLTGGRLGITGYKSGAFPASVNDFLRENLPSAGFEDATSVLLEAINEVSRCSEEELAFLKKACEIHDISFEAVARALRPGVTEKELWGVASKSIIENGGWAPHFMLVTSGPRPTFPRAPASHHPLSNGDIIIFETNVLFGGVCSQICFALSLGEPDPVVGAMFDFCGELYQTALRELEKDRKFGDIEQDLVDRIHAAGYEPMTPQIHVYNMAIEMPSDIPPQPGDYFTVHPNFCNKDYTAGAKFGDAVRITKARKVERLQKTPARLNIVPV